MRRGAMDDLATVMFTSGATGEPKGVMLSHHNIVSNIEAFSEVLSFGPADTMMGMLPPFHSFGFTATLWTPLTHAHARGLSPEPARRERRRPHGGEIPRDGHRRDLVLLRAVRARLRAGAVPLAAPGGRRGAEARPGGGGGVRGAVRPAADRRLRLHGAFAGRGRQRAGCPRRRREADRRARRLGRPPAAGTGNPRRGPRDAPARRPATRRASSSSAGRA